MSVEISLYIQTERKTKFVSRFDTGISSPIVPVKDVKNKVLEHVSRSVPSIRHPEASRLTLSLPESDGGVKLNASDKIGTDGGGAHLIATYKNFGEPDVEPEQRSKTIEEMLDSSDPKFYTIAVRDPYNSEAEPVGLNVPAQMPVNKVLNKMKSAFYRPDFKGAQPSHCGLMVSFGAPSNEVDEEETITVTKAEMEQIMRKMRDDIIAGRVNVESSDDEPLVMPLVEPVNEVSASSQATFNAFTGTGMKLGEDIKIEKVKDIPAKEEEEPVGDDRWETDAQPIPLNQKSDEMPHQYYVSIEGKIVYTFYGNRNTDFGILIDELRNTGCDIGAPNEKNQFHLKYNKSFAFRHEKLSDWGGDGTTYVVAPRIPLSGGGYVKQSIGKNKGSPHQTPRLSKSKMIEGKKAIVADCNASLKDVVFQTERVSELSEEAGKKMRELYDMCENGLSRDAMKKMVASLDEEGFKKLLGFPSGRPDDKAYHVASVLLSYYIPKVTKAHSELEAVNSSSQAVAELVLSDALSRDNGVMEWAILAHLIENERDVRARVKTTPA